MKFLPEKTQVGDFPYIIGMVMTVAIGVAGYYLVKNKSYKFKKWFIFVLLFFNFALHFLKIFNSYYQARLPEHYAAITFDNICAVSVLLFPFVYISKSKALKDYMFYLGILSGVAAIVYPTGGVLNRAPYAFDYFRFYICHGIIMFAPIYMVGFKLHTLDYKRIWKTPFVFWGVLTLIFINTILLGELGITDIRSANFLDPGYERNASLVFGTTKEFEKAADAVLGIFVPKFLKQVPFGAYAGQKKYVPLLWLFVPSYIYAFAVSVIMSIPFCKKQMKKDFHLLKTKIRVIFKISTEPRPLYFDDAIMRTEIDKERQICEEKFGS